jgi:hypothetical protein
MSAIGSARRKYFTPQQANAMLPLLKLIVRDISNLAQALREQHRRLAQLEEEQADLDEIVGEIERTQDEMHAHAHELEQLQVELKDPLAGLVDFRSRLNGREVYLCWRLGETEVAHWHELDAGFVGRQKLAKINNRPKP